MRTSRAADFGKQLARRAVAVAILAIAAYILLKFVIGIVTAIAWTVAAIVAVIALIWALRVLL
jgi:hypothetical protein